MAEVVQFSEIYRLHVMLLHINPPIWRRLLVCDNTSIADLHDILQISFEWTDFHLHRFLIRGKEYGVGRAGCTSFSTDARKTLLSHFRFRLNERFLYEYDFGDLWQHQVRIEGIELSEQKKVCCNTNLHFLCCKVGRYICIYFTCVFRHQGLQGVKIVPMDDKVIVKARFPVLLYGLSSIDIQLPKRNRQMMRVDELFTLEVKCWHRPLFSYNFQKHYRPLCSVLEVFFRYLCFYVLVLGVGLLHFNNRNTYVRAQFFPSFCHVFGL